MYTNKDALNVLDVTTKADAILHIVESLMFVNQPSYSYVDKETDKSGTGGEKEVSVKVEIPPVKRADSGEKKVVSGTDSLKEQQLKRKVAQYYGLEEACIEIWWEDDQGEMAVPAPVGSDLNDTVHAISGEQN